MDHSVFDLFSAIYLNFYELETTKDAHSHFSLKEITAQFRFLDMFNLSFIEN